MKFSQLFNFSPQSNRPWLKDRLITFRVSIINCIIVIATLVACKNQSDHSKVIVSMEDSSGSMTNTEYPNDIAYSEGPNELELEAETILERYDIDTLQMGTFSQALHSLSSTVPEFEDFERSLQCKIALKKVREKKCEAPIKYLSDIVRKKSFGQFELDKEGKIIIKGPKFATFKKQVNRLNGLIVIFNNNRLKYCDMHRWCDPVYIGHHCGTLTSDDRKTYQKCEAFYTVDRYKDLEDILTSISSAFNQLEDDGMTNEQVKAVMEAELDKLEDATKKETEEVEKEEEATEIDSTQQSDDKAIGDISPEREN